ncbi:MAG: nucleotidyltransferase domain-containing protein [bacterium]|nr:nucleotidyltransferase domain-containing protein [bacterium]
MESSITKEKIQEVVDKIAKDHNPEKIILFGSWAWGKPTKDSDVDLLIVKESQKKGREIAYEIDRSISHRPFAIDILAYTPQEVKEKVEKDRNLFIEDVIINGKILYAKS